MEVVFRMQMKGKEGIDVEHESFNAINRLPESACSSLHLQRAIYICFCIVHKINDKKQNQK